MAPFTRTSKIPFVNDDGARLFVVQLGPMVFHNTIGILEIDDKDQIRAQMKDQIRAQIAEHGYNPADFSAQIAKALEKAASFFLNEDPGPFFA